MKKIYILHPGKASYPDIHAYREYFNDKFHIYDGTVEDYRNFNDKSNTILWCIMGYYPKRLNAYRVIHDYRSLSVGKFSALKDKIKACFNIKPDVRIFLNTEVRKQMNFSDGIPEYLLDMGVPNWIFNIEPSVEFSGTFCYLGDMSLERGFDKIIDGFLRSRTKNDSFVLIGKPQKELLDKYIGTEGLIFTGFKNQREALAIVKACKYAVSFIPYHRPYCYQTPTKLLEYAALGMNIICNDSPSNIDALKSLDVEANITGGTIFDNLKLSNTIYNDINKIKSLEWPSVIEASGIVNYLSDVNS